MFTRDESLAVAIKSKRNLQQCDTEEMIDQISLTMLVYQHLDVWKDVFRNHSAMLERIQMYIDYTE